MPAITAKYRKFLYWAAIVVAVAAFGTGLITPEQANAGIDTASQAVTLLASVLALLHITPDTYVE